MKRERPVHVYADDGTVDHRGEGRCASCGLPQGNRRVHDLPPRSEDERAMEARRMGEC